MFSKVGPLLRWYSENLRKHQFVMNMVSTGAVFLLGDMLSQQVIEKKGTDHKTERTVRSVVVGTLYIAPFVTFLYNFLDKPRVFGSSQTVLNSLKKTVLMCSFSPVTTGGFVIINNFLQGKSNAFTLNQIKYDLPTIVLTQWKIWVPAHFILLTVVPLRHRMFLSNFVGVLWTCYLTHASNVQGYQETDEVNKVPDEITK